MRDQLSSGEERRRNLRLALILASVAAAFFVGFIVKMSMFGHH
jgi:hypothetical protein